MHKKFQVNQTKIKGGCQSAIKAANCCSCTDLTLTLFLFCNFFWRNLAQWLLRIYYFLKWVSLWLNFHYLGFRYLKIPTFSQSMGNRFGADRHSFLSSSHILRIITCWLSSEPLKRQPNLNVVQVCGHHFWVRTDLNNENNVLLFIIFITAWKSHDLIFFSASFASATGNNNSLSRWYVANKQMITFQNQ